MAAEQVGQRGAINRRNSRTSRPDRPRACSLAPKTPQQSAADGTAMAASGVSIDITGCMTALDAEGREFVVSTNSAPQLWWLSTGGAGRPHRRSQSCVQAHGAGAPLRGGVGARPERRLGRRDASRSVRIPRSSRTPRLPRPWRAPRAGEMWHARGSERRSAFPARRLEPSRFRREWLTTSAQCTLCAPAGRIARGRALPLPPSAPGAVATGCGTRCGALVVWLRRGAGSDMASLLVQLLPNHGRLSRGLSSRGPPAAPPRACNSAPATPL